MVNKFNSDKFKSKMVFATKNLWDIVDDLEAPPPSTANDNDKKTHERQCKKAFAIRSWCTSKGAKDRRKHGKQILQQT